MVMEHPPQLSAYGTLLYADPNEDTERSFLQPFYGVTVSVTENAHNQDSLSPPSIGERTSLSADPQPVFGGAALGHEPPPTGVDEDGVCASSLRTWDPKVRFFDDKGVPLVDAILDKRKREVIQQVLKPYPAPSPRSGHVWLPVPARRSIILYGGLGRVTYDDTWEYMVDTGRWRQLSCVTVAPPPLPGSAPVHASASATKELPPPPPAYGQAAAIYTNDDGDTCMVVLGGITSSEECVGTAHSLNIARGEWTSLELTIPFKPIWGAAAQTLIDRRPYPRTCAGASSTPTEEDEEEVVVLFGGMDNESVSSNDTLIYHLSHRLTLEEVMANQERFLASVNYENEVHHRMQALLQEEDDAREAAGMPRRSCEELARWPQLYVETLSRWRIERLHGMVGKYWVERVPPSTRALHGRRRSCTAVYRRHFMFLFAGRDRWTFYNDFWVFNLPQRMWIQIFLTTPATWLHRMYTEPYNAHWARLIASLAEEQRVVLMEINPHVSPLFDTYTLGDNMPISSQYSHVKPRTGACMFIDPVHDRLYIFGGYLFQQDHYVHFGDMNVYYIHDHVWRKVHIASCRHWDVHLDGGATFVHRVDPLRDARSLSPPEQPPPETAWDEATHFAAEADTHHPTYHMTNGNETNRVHQPCGSCPFIEPSIPMAPRNARRALLSDADAARAEWFALPVVTPRPRTMAAVAGDPVAPGTRFFLYGGRFGEDVIGDLFDLRITDVTRSDNDFQTLQERMSERGPEPGPRPPLPNECAAVQLACSKNSQRKVGPHVGRATCTLRQAAVCYLRGVLCPSTDWYTLRGVETHAFSRALHPSSGVISNTHLIEMRARGAALHSALQKRFFTPDGTTSTEQHDSDGYPPAPLRDTSRERRWLLVETLEEARSSAPFTMRELLEPLPYIPGIFTMLEAV